MVFYRKGILKNFAKFTRKYLFWSLLYSKFPGKFIKKDTLTQAFSYELCDNFKKRFLQNTSGRLLLPKAMF